MKLFKIWDAKRTSKVLIAVDENLERLYETVVLKASEKMQLNGSTLVLEADGTSVDEDDTLRLLQNETLIILQANESWRSSEDVAMSQADTISVIGSSFAESKSAGTTSLTLLSPIPQEDSCERRSTEYDGSSDSSSSGIQSPSLISENTWKKFQIPWEKLSASAIKDCQQGIRNKISIHEVINATATKMRELKSNVPSKAIKYASQKIATKYPKMFEDADDDGEVLGDGTHTLFTQLENRIKYLNRSAKRGHVGIVADIPLKKKKITLMAKAGCTNWQPSVDNNDSPVTLEDMKVALLTANFEEFSDETIRMLEATYPNQRMFLNDINNPPSIIDIKQNWPILLSQNGIYWHYQKLMGQDVNTLCDKMLAKTDKIVNFGRSKKIVTSDDVPISEEEKLITILRIICKFYSEDMNSIYTQINEEADIEQYEIRSPCIVVILKDSKTYHVVVEQQKINGGCTSLRNAIQQMFALYYNMNLAYPKSVSNTLETIQTYFLKIRPDQGTKNRKQSKCKLLSLLNKLRNF